MRLANKSLSRGVRFRRGRGSGGGGTAGPYTSVPIAALTDSIYKSSSSPPAPSFAELPLRERERQRHARVSEKTGGTLVTPRPARGSISGAGGRVQGIREILILELEEFGGWKFWLLGNGCVRCDPDFNVAGR